MSTLCIGRQLPDVLPFLLSVEHAQHAHRAALDFVNLDRLWWLELPSKSAPSLGPAIDA
jgi:hypothetical protein